MKLRIEILNDVAETVQTEEFELNGQAQALMTTVNTMHTGSLRVTAVVEKHIASPGIPAGVPRG